MAIPTARSPAVLLPEPSSQCSTQPRLLTDLQLPLDPALAALPVVGLRGVVFRHHLHKLA